MYKQTDEAQDARRCTFVAKVNRSPSQVPAQAVIRASTTAVEPWVVCGWTCQTGLKETSEKHRDRSGGHGLLHRNRNRTPGFRRICKQQELRSREACTPILEPSDLAERQWVHCVSATRQIQLGPKLSFSELHWYSRINRSCASSANLPSSLQAPSPILLRT